MNESQSPQVMTSQPGRQAAVQGKSRLPLVIVGIVVLFAAGVGLWWWLAANNATSPSTGDVSITDNSFEPSTIKIKKGESITWTNQDSKDHQVYADQSIITGLDSQQPLGQGDSYSFTFEKEGTYHYFDSLHPTRLTGTVIVE